MSHKNSTDWTDHILAESGTPDGDDFVWTEGTNYGMDGFGFERTMGKGTQAPKNTPGMSPGNSPGSTDLITQDVSGLPDSVMASELDYEFDMDTTTEAMVDLNDGMHLGHFFGESEIPMSEGARKQASLADLDWLDPAQPHDPNHIPLGLDEERKPWNVVPELEEAWGKFYPKHNNALVPNVDLSRAQYEEALNDKVPSVPGASSNYTLGQKQAAIQRAMRRSHFGHSLAAIGRELKGHLGDTPLFRVAMTQIDADHGLAGTVFVRAAAFPGLNNGKWVKELRKHARTARYIITPHNRVASRLAKVKVSSVPWGEALRHYAPRLHSLGYRLAGSDPKAILKQAFREGPEEIAHEASLKPIERMPADSISLEAAMESFNNAEAEVPVVVSAKSRQQGAKRAKTQAAILKMVKKGHITREDAQAIMKSGLSPVSMLRVAAAASNQIEGVTYQGDGLGAGHVVRETKKSSGVTTAERTKLSRWLRQKMAEGNAGRELDELTLARWSKPLLHRAASAVRKVRAEHEGLSGYAYVDAAAYASPTGTKGCNAGALKHRANAIKSVLAFDRCGSCTLSKALPNGRKLCSNYNKALVEEAPVQNRAAYQKKAIEIANQSDFEHTASLISNPSTSVNFTPAEFNLQAGLDIELDEFKSTEELSEILFSSPTLEV